MLMTCATVPLSAILYRVRQKHLTVFEMK